MNWERIAKVTGAIVGLAAVLALLGYTVDRPAWHSEVVKVGQKSQQNTWGLIKQEQDYINDRKDRYEEEKKPIPKWLKDRQRKLDDKKQEAGPPPKKY